MTIELSDSQLENRVLWVRDLLSDQFEQGQKRLKTVSLEDGKVTYCCLGVACERLYPDSDMLIIRDNGLSRGAYMNDATAALVGLDYGDQGQAGRWNDVHGFSFARIADLIAYATVEKVRFDHVQHHVVQEGYAVGWLRQFDK